jgi:hypothetical protein
MEGFNYYLVSRNAAIVYQNHNISKFTDGDERVLVVGKANLMVGNVK